MTKGSIECNKDIAETEHKEYTTKWLTSEIISSTVAGLVGLIVIACILWNMLIKPLWLLAHDYHREAMAYVIFSALCLLLVTLSKCASNEEK